MIIQKIKKTEAAVENALKLDGSTFKDRQLKVTPKRVNDPNYFAQQSGGYQGGRGRVGFRGGFRGGGRGAYRGGYPMGRGRGGRGKLCSTLFHDFQDDSLLYALH